MIRKRIIGDFCSLQFLRFLVTGGVCAGINFFSRFLFQLLFTYTESVTLGFIAGTFASFVLNRQYTFRSFNDRIVIQAIRFALIAVGGIGLGTLIAYTCMTLYDLLGGSFVSVGIAESASHMISIALTTGYNFLAMKYLCFERLPAAEARDL